LGKRSRNNAVRPTIQAAFLGKGTNISGKWRKLLGQLAQAFEKGPFLPNSE
jgi:hypothetical protein